MARAAAGHFEPHARRYPKKEKRGIPHQCVLLCSHSR